MPIEGAQRLRESSRCRFPHCSSMQGSRAISSIMQLVLNRRLSKPFSESKIAPRVNYIMQNSNHLPARCLQRQWKLPATFLLIISLV